MTADAKTLCLVLPLLALGCVDMPGDLGESCSEHGFCAAGLHCDLSTGSCEPGPPRDSTLECGACPDIAPICRQGLCFDDDAAPCGYYVDEHTDGDVATTSAMCRVEAGSYPVGVSAAQVDMPSYYVDRFEVTNERYLRYVLSLPPGAERERALPTCTVDPISRSWSRSEPYYSNVPMTLDHHPVVCVTRVQAVDFCTWAGKRLPTRKEWEVAARGPNDSYPWGGGWDLGTRRNANCRNPDPADGLNPCNSLGSPRRSS